MEKKDLFESREQENKDHREISKDLGLYFFDDKIGQGLPSLLSD
jgi:threonyl-tRNA synthetase